MLIEQEHKVVSLRKWIPGEQEGDDAVQFVAQHGGVRNVKVADLTVL